MVMAFFAFVLLLGQLNLVYAVFLYDHTTGLTLLRQKDMRYFNMCTNLNTCRTHKGGSDTNKSAQELTQTRRDRKIILQPARSDFFFFLPFLFFANLELESCRKILILSDLTDSLYLNASFHFKCKCELENT